MANFRKYLTQGDFPRKCIIAPRLSKHNFYIFCAVEKKVMFVIKLTKWKRIHRVWDWDLPRLWDCSWGIWWKVDRKQLFACFSDKIVWNGRICKVSDFVQLQQLKQEMQECTELNGRGGQLPWNKISPRHDEHVKIWKLSSLITPIIRCNC